MEAAKVKAKKLGKWSRLEVLDVTKFPLMSGDGHLGLYLVANPFASGVLHMVQNVCVHWCLTGPMDTWNEISQIRSRDEEIN